MNHFQGLWKQGSRTGTGNLHFVNGEIELQEWKEPSTVRYIAAEPLRFPN
jgi:hypothetical protein